MADKDNIQHFSVNSSALDAMKSSQGGLMATHAPKLPFHSLLSTDQCNPLSPTFFFLASERTPQSQQSKKMRRHGNARIKGARVMNATDEMHSPRWHRNEPSRAVNRHGEGRKADA
jgi:hypothetical protein